MAMAYLPWNDQWSELITYMPWVQPEEERMADSPMLPAYPVFKSAVDHGLEGEPLTAAVAGAMVTILGHRPDDPLAPLYRAWLAMYDPSLSRQLLLEGTNLSSRFDFGEAIWMLQASLMLEPASYEAHYNLGLFSIMRNRQHYFIAIAVSDYILQQIIENTGICVGVYSNKVLCFGYFYFVFKVTVF